MESTYKLDVSCHIDLHMSNMWVSKLHSSKSSAGPPRRSGPCANSVTDCWPQRPSRKRCLTRLWLCLHCSSQAFTRQALGLGTHEYEAWQQRSHISIVGFQRPLCRKEASMCDFENSMRIAALSIMSQREIGVELAKQGVVGQSRGGHDWQIY